VTTDGDFVGTDDVSFANKELHIDGTITANGDCNNCHGYPPGSTDGWTEINAGGKGAHDTVADSHVKSAELDATADVYGDTGTGFKECYVCHAGGSHDDGTVDMGFNGIVNSFVGAAPQYGGTPGTTAKKTCSNVNCHFGKETPKWSCP
jgi:hypothetical protein